MTDVRKSVVLSDDISTTTLVNTPIIDKRSGIAPKKFSHERLSSKIFGYSFTLYTGVEKVIDDRKIAPNGIDSLALTQDTP